MRGGGDGVSTGVGINYNYESMTMRVIRCLSYSISIYDGNMRYVRLLLSVAYWLNGTGRAYCSGEIACRTTKKDGVDCGWC